MGVTDTEEMEGPAVDPDGHSQIDPPDRGRQRSGPRAGRRAWRPRPARPWSAWSSPVKASRRASPPNFSSAPPLPYATSSMRENTWLRTSVSSSAPMRPRRASRSESAVNPEMSTKQQVASSWRQRAPGTSRSHSAARRGTYGSSPSSTAVLPIGNQPCNRVGQPCIRLETRLGGTIGRLAHECGQSRDRAAPGASPSARRPRPPPSGTRRAPRAGSVGTTAR